MSVYLQDADLTLHHGDAATVLADLPEGSVDCVVTSPPYFGLRDYGVECQIGLEPTPEEYVAALVGVFRQVWRVLAPWGCCFVNIGDSYYSPTATQGRNERKSPTTSTLADHGENGRSPALDAQTPTTYRRAVAGLKPKDLLMMPARLALALQADGWWVRSRIVWAKPNPMPESVTDRPTSAHEDVYLLTRAQRYYYDAEAVREANTDYSILKHSSPNVKARAGEWKMDRNNDRNDGQSSTLINGPGRDLTGRNLRNVWSIATEPTPEAHFATFPTELVRRCLAAGCPERVCRECGEPSRRIVEVDYEFTQKVHNRTKHQGTTTRVDRSALMGVPANKLVTTTGWTDCGHDAWRPGIVLDPFVGSGTTALVARRLGLHAVGIDASAEYLAIAAKRLQQLSLLGGVA